MRLFHLFFIDTFLALDALASLSTSVRAARSPLNTSVVAATSSLNKSVVAANSPPVLPGPVASLPPVPPKPFSAGINTDGSIMCNGHGGQLRSLIRQLEAIPYPDQTSFSNDGAGSAIGCISFAGIGKRRRASIPDRGLSPRDAGDGDLEGCATGGAANYSSVAAALAKDACSNHGGKESICAFYQGTGDATFSLTTTLNYLRTLSAYGADPCGSIQINEPYGNNVTGGELTVNYNFHGACDGYCGSSHDKIGENGIVYKKDPVFNYAPGQCTLHLTWYQQDTQDKDPNYYLGVTIKDANHILVGANYYVRAPVDTMVGVSSPNLPYVFQFTVHSDTTPIQVKYGNSSWDTTRCTNSGFDSGKAGLDCDFDCGRSLGPACFAATNGEIPPQGIPVPYC